VRIKQAEADFRTRFRALLEAHLSGLGEIALPEDITVLMGQTDSGTVAEVEVAPSADAAAAQPTTVMPAVAAEPPESGFVTSVTLGEVDSPDLGPEEPDFSAPLEFNPGSFGDLGERDDDLDIEEID
jgi:hypothetical protein